MKIAELIYEKMKALLPGVELELADMQDMVESSKVDDVNELNGYQVVVKVLIEVIQDLTNEN
jgi:hypothetical protein